MRLRRRNRRRHEAVELEISPIPLIDRADPVFTLGSCFAIELRKHMRALGCNVLEVDEPKARNTRDVLAWYHTYSLLYECQLAAGRFHRGEEDIWQIKGIYQDAIRRTQTAPDMSSLMQKIQATDALVIEGLKKAKLVVFTLGLCEVWRSRVGEKHVACVGPQYQGGGRYNRAKFEIVSYNQNLINLSQCIAILKEINPDANLLLTVSPVPFSASWRKDVEHFTANMESKSILRAVAGHLARDYENVHYFPSYEVAMTHAPEQRYYPDGRHIQKHVVRQIMQYFETAYIRGD